MPYTKLFEPGRIGGLEIRNRIVMPAMGCSLAEVTGEPGPRMIKYYADRARGGAGMIITEITRIDDETVSARRTSSASPIRTSSAS